MQRCIESFLKLGYYLDYSPSVTWPRKVEPGGGSDVPSRELLIEAVGRSLGAIKAPSIVVPLSGGLDSRLLLACVLEHYEAVDVNTYTFGEPGTWDYDLGNRVASAFGTRHERINLARENYTLESALYDSASVCAQTIIIFGTPFYFIKRVYGDSAAFISGFMGDPVAGSKLPTPNEQSEAQTAAGFIEKHTVAFPKLKTTTCMAESIAELDDERLTKSERLDFANRQFKYIAPHVCPDETYFSPFMDPQWVGAMLNLPSNLRVDCRFYRDMCIREFPEFFGLLPVKGAAGGNLASNRAAVFTRKAINRLGVNLARAGVGNWQDRGQNYLNLTRRMARDTAFNRLVEYLESIGVRYAATRCDAALADLQPRTELERVILASLGAHSLSR